MRSALFVCMLVLLFGLTLAACHPSSGPSSREYKPVSEWEQLAFSKANRGIYPDDVRKNTSAYDSTLIAWPGIVLSATPTRTDSTLEVHFVIQHHYYDWIEDFSIQKEHIFLSPRGEGRFTTVWALNATADTSYPATTVGNMVIVYGIPSGIKDSVIALRAHYIREIKRPFFATDIFDYGRDMSDLKVLRVPME